MATPVGITMNARRGEFNVTVSVTSDTIAPSGVLAVQLRRAAKAMSILISDDVGTDSVDDDSDVF